MCRDKITKKSCKYITRKTKLLGLIHSDFGDLKHTITRGGKRFYLIFIDNHSRFTNPYLLITKEEAILSACHIQFEVTHKKIGKYLEKVINLVWNTSKCGGD